MDKEIVRIINKAFDGTLLTKSEIATLFAVKNLSPEAFAIEQAGRAYTAMLCDDTAEVHAHIGLDAAPCPMDCEFCSFAESNGVFTEKVVYPKENVIASALDFEAAGANALYLVTTLLYKKSDFLETAAEVRYALKTDIPLVANIPDFGSDYAKKLAEVGVTGIYHVIRLDEGVHTKGKLSTRIRTIEAALDAGLKVGNCIEPIGPEHAPEDVAELVITARDLGVSFSGAMRRVTVPGTYFEQFGDLPFGRLAIYAGAIALGTGSDIKGNCTHEPSQLCAQAGANIMWASCGTDPRDTQAETSRGYTVNQVKEMYFETDWKVLEGPSRFYR